jgi:2-polyprenyl-6-methoxyphenol hydroxylase-like FAD-dependent oxidoreductase
VTRALIIGAGIAGAATALAMRRVGIDAVVYEAHPTGGDDVGAFLTVMDNGMAALRVIEADRAVVDNSHPAGAVEVFDADGRSLGRRVLGDGPRTLRRSTLYRVLQDLAVARGIPVVHGKRLVSATTIHDGVSVSFADGTGAAGDLLVGADGIHSVTRRLIDPDAPQPRYTGQNVVYGYAEAGAAPTAPDAYHMVYGRGAFFGYTTPPDGHTWWFARITAPARADRPTAAQWKRLALDAFADDPTPAAVVAATGDEVTGGNAYDIATTPRWHAGPMVLAGDAAHAASPAAAQGASMALEDAVALAECLRDADDPGTAFARYESVRREPAEATVAASARMAAG